MSEVARIVRAALLLTASGIALAAPPTATMQAAVVAQGRIKVQSVPIPKPAAHQVLVRVRVAGINPADWKTAAEPRPPIRPNIPGYDGAGTIAALGAGVTGFKVGEPVILWSAKQGSYAQYVAVAADAVIAKPDTLSFAQAAGLPYASLTAWNLLVDGAHVANGQKVLILGGAGGVGSAAIQIAAQRGAHVSATASTHNIDYLKSLGVEQAIDYTQAHFEDRLRSIDIAVNTVDIDNAERALAVLRPGGILASVAGLPTPAQCQARGVRCIALTTPGTPALTVLKQLTDWASQRQLRINVDKTFALQEVSQAWLYSQSGHTRGKSVIELSD